ncbi:LppX_LprAFG lipoprotein [Nocardioides sp. CER19]|uniref:LppX_LprAFG lipoprotein n=1 Tax=Nocardioides sp. CER19 TaxID=3038538 RepID=UPI0024494DA9|nr:LppX_LprAFG lipoprotein [Nocardioides sp. CER19]MDH2416587.1 LppX_LprAFG lipoprotein [Nocardioides sp. CER19]
MRRPVLAALAAALLLAGCSGGGGSDKPTLTPDKVMALAKAKLDETSGVHFTLDSKNVDASTTGLLSAQGVLTHAPAFDGKIVVQVAGLKPEVPVIAVDGKVYAQLPLTTGWQDINPADYGAPDPAALMSPDHGLSSMLTATTGLKKGKTVRGGAGNKEILTSYSGTLPASSAAVIVPTVKGDVDATYTVTDDHELRQAVLTGDFYGTGNTETYTVTVDQYGTEKDIKAP